MFLMETQSPTPGCPAAQPPHDPRGELHFGAGFLAIHSLSCSAAWAPGEEQDGLQEVLPLPARKGAAPQPGPLQRRWSARGREAASLIRSRSAGCAGGGLRVGWPSRPPCVPSSPARHSTH